mgnify:CR=1 FL=1
MTPEIINILTSFGGLGVLALFAYMLLKSYTKNMDRITKLMDKHFEQDIENQTNINIALGEIIYKLKKLNGKAID